MLKVWQVVVKLKRLKKFKMNYHVIKDVIYNLPREPLVVQKHRFCPIDPWLIMVFRLEEQGQKKRTESLWGLVYNYLTWLNLWLFILDSWSRNSLKGPSENLFQYSIFSCIWHGPRAHGWNSVWVNFCSSISNIQSKTCNWCNSQGKMYSCPWDANDVGN